MDSDTSSDQEERDWPHGMFYNEVLDTYLPGCCPVLHTCNELLIWDEQMDQSRRKEEVEYERATLCVRSSPGV